MAELDTLTQPPSLGARLRAARERAGLDKQQAADKLHCDAYIIDALEDERFEALGAPVYARGHVRRYAELVGESPAELQDLFLRRTANSSQMPDLTRVPKAERPADPRSLVAPVAFAGITLLIAAAAWWVLKGQGPRTTAASTPSQAVAAPAAPRAVAPPANFATTASAATPAAIDSVVGLEHQLTDSSTKPAAAPAILPATAAGAAAAGGARPNAAAFPGGVAVRLTAADDCWIEAYDAAGKRIYFGMASPNSVQQFTGPSPLRVLLGNVAAVRLEVDGKLVSIPNSVRRGTSAWFAVEAGGQIKPTAELAVAATPNDSKRPVALATKSADRKTPRPRPPATRPNKRP